jgi:hypothetical protein
MLPPAADYTLATRSRVLCPQTKRALETSDVQTLDWIHVECGRRQDSVFQHPNSFGINDLTTYIDTPETAPCC